MKKKIYLPLMVTTSIIPITVIASCGSSQLKDDLDNHVKSLEWKSLKEHSQVEVGSITNENQLLEYFSLENKKEDLYKYEFKSVGPEPNRPGKLKVSYQVTNLKHEDVTMIFSKMLFGFKGDDGSSPDNELNQDLQLVNQAIKNATFSVEDDEKNPDQIQPSELIWNERSKYPGVKIKFEDLKADINTGTLGFDAIFSSGEIQKKLVVLPEDEKAIKNLLVVESINKTIEQIWREVKKILKPDIKITISDREVESGWTPEEIKNSFKSNETDIKNIFNGTRWEFIDPSQSNNYGARRIRPVDEFKIEPTKAILSYFFGAKHRATGEIKSEDFSIELDGFKPPARGELDVKDNVNIKLPPGAVSYKGKLFKRQGKPRLTANNDKDNINKMTWSQYRLEMLFQARFLLHQEFSDENLEEVDYYTLQDEENGYLTVEAQGILNKDIELTHSLQFINIGPTPTDHYRKQKYKKGDVVKMRFRSRWEPYYSSTVTGAPSWKPVPADHGGFKFSFTDDPTQIDKTLKPMTKFSLNMWYFEWYLNDQTWVSENHLVYYHATPFLFYSTYKDWD